MTTLREFIAEISKTKDELQDKEIVIEARNGLLCTPKVKFIPNEIGEFVLDAEHIDKVVLCF
jgi:hypothetical protein